MDARVVVFLVQEALEWTEATVQDKLKIAELSLQNDRHNKCAGFQSHARQLSSE